jgi:hypothetical protein
VAAPASTKASLLLNALRLAPKMSNSQLASKPTLNEFVALLLSELPPDLPRCAEAELPKDGHNPAAVTSRCARDCRKLACAPTMLVLACKAVLTNWLSSGSLKLDHHVTSEIAGDVPATPASDHVEGTTKGNVVLVCCGTELQAHSNATKKLGMTHFDEGFVRVMVRIVQSINMNFAPYLRCRLFARALSDTDFCLHTYTC